MLQRCATASRSFEFLNEVLIAFCKEHGIELTRSRPYRKNDQAWVEQKNGAVVRRLVGYGESQSHRGRTVASVTPSRHVGRVRPLARSLRTG